MKVWRTWNTLRLLVKEKIYTTTLEKYLIVSMMGEHLHTPFTALYDLFFNKARPFKHLYFITHRK